MKNYPKPDTALSQPAVPPTNSPTAEPDAAAALEDPALSTGPEPFDVLARYVASSFVRRDNRFFQVDNWSNGLSADDVKRVCIQRFPTLFPAIPLSQELVRRVFQKTMEENHSDLSLTVPVWNGRAACRPDVQSRLITDNGLVSINSWKQPSYRGLGITESSWGPLLDILNTMMPRDEDRGMFLSWLSWSLQNEADKPAWAIMLYSRRKGTGKSTLCQLVTRLFGRDNSITQNSVSKLTQQFNRPVLLSKCVVGEELHLKPGSTQANTVKTFITEKDTVAEAKGQEIQRLEQCCCFLFTTNHMPFWIEEGERRIFVIDVDHDGHASGPKAEEFGATIARLVAFMEDEEAMAKLYNRLMVWPKWNGFNAKSLNTETLSSPIMQQLRQSSREVMLEQLDELLAERGIFAIGLQELADLCHERLRLSANRLKHFMNELRWRSETVKWGGVDHRRTLYVHPDYQVSNGQVLGPDGYKKPIGSSRLDDFIILADTETGATATPEEDTY